MNYLEIYFNGALKHSIPIQSDVISIGRASDNDVVIDNMGVSSHHAIISKKNNLFFIEDLNSTNGTFLNSQKISSQHKINQQDSVIIGKHTLKFSDWHQSTGASSTVSIRESNDATVMMSKSKKQSTQTDPQQNQFYLIMRGEKTGINKLLLNNNHYGIGKAKDNDIRIGGWFTPAYIAEIEKIGHSFYIIPLKDNKVKLNDNIINNNVLLSPSDEIKIKKLVIKFLTD